MTDPSDEPEPARQIRFDVPGAARLWNYFSGGKDNYDVDRAAGEAALELYDFATLAQESRRFLVRAVQFLAGEAGIRQFLDVGAGLPTTENTHQIAQALAPDSRIVYVDNDPIVLAHARALLVNTTPEGATSYVEADYHDPEFIVSHAKSVLDFDQPVAVMFMGVLGHARDYDTARSIVEHTMEAVPSGSFLALWDQNDITPNLDVIVPGYQATGAVPYVPPPIEKIRRCFDGLDIVDPGLVPITQWRPAAADIGRVAALDETTGGVARKP